MFGKDVELVGGQSVKFDDAYIRESILNPSAQVVEGYQPIMPTFKGQVTEEQLISLVAYIKSLSGITATTTSGGSTGGTTTGQQPTSANPSVGTNANTLTPRRGDRGQDANASGSNPNAPRNRTEPANRQQ
jgi:hypothetical protein